jgi:hypothetical protein
MSYPVQEVGRFDGALPELSLVVSKVAESSRKALGLPNPDLSPGPSLLMVNETYLSFSFLTCKMQGLPWISRASTVHSESPSSPSVLTFSFFLSI